MKPLQIHIPITNGDSNHSQVIHISLSDLLLKGLLS